MDIKVLNKAIFAFLKLCNNKTLDNFFAALKKYGLINAEIKDEEIEQWYYINQNIVDKFINNSKYFNVYNSNNMIGLISLIQDDKEIK